MLMTNEREKRESFENRPWTVRDFGGINWNRDRQILLDVLQILTIVFVAPVA